jgi:hypothetical protein
MLDAQTYSALPPERQVEIAAELLKRGDWETIENLGIEIVDADQWAQAGESDVVRVNSLN